MKNFTYYTPTKVVFGKDTEAQTGKLIREFGGTKVLLHYGGGSAERSGLLGRIRASLEEEGLAYVELGGVKPNPRLSKVHEGLDLCRKEGVDFILAVGGGSTIDSAKAIGYGLANGGDPWDFHMGRRQAQGCTPIGAVLTIAAVGREMGNVCEVTSEEGGTDRELGLSESACRFVVL